LSLIPFINNLNFISNSFSLSPQLFDLSNGRYFNKAPIKDSILEKVEAISLDGRFKSSISQDRRNPVGLIYDIKSGNLLTEFNGHSGTINSIKFSQNGRYILTGSTDTLAILWNRKTGKEVTRYDQQDKISGVVNDVEFSNCNKYIFTASSDNMIRM